MLKQARRDIFNKVRNHLIKQADQSTDTGNASVCAYRGVKGMSCAIGCLITDEHYDKRIEGHGLNLEVIALVEKSLGVDIDSQCRYMLGELQTLHDSCDNEDWELDLDALQESLIEEGTF